MREKNETSHVKIYTKRRDENAEWRRKNRKSEKLLTDCHNLISKTTQQIVIKTTKRKIMYYHNININTKPEKKKSLTT